MSSKLPAMIRGWKGANRFFQLLRSIWLFFALFAVTASAFHTGALNPLKTAIYELRFTLTSRPPTGEVALVEIDAKSIAAIGRWPWPRRIHADLITEISRAGASQIAFDVDFSSASNEEDDGILEDALRQQGGTVILAAFAQRRSNAAGDQEITFNRAIERFAQHSWSATVNVFADRDGVVRKFPFGDMVAGEPTPSMPAMLAGGSGELGRDFLIDFGIQGSKIDRISAIDVIRHTVDDGRLAGKIVIIGASAVELRDFYHVPVFGMIPGPLVQALAVEAILQGRKLAESGPLFALGGALLIILAGAFSSTRVRWSTGLVVVAGLSLAFEALGVFTLSLYPMLIDTSPWQVALLGLGILGTIREIDFRRILLAISRQEAQDTKTVLDQVVADNFAGVIVATGDGVIRAASRAATDLLNGDSADALVGRNVDEALPPALAQVIRDSIIRFKEGKWQPREPGDFEYTTPGNDTSILEYVVTPSRLGGESVSSDGDLAPDRMAACLTFVDITERRNAESRIAYMARFDTLTGLPNHNQLAEKLAAATAKGRSNGDSCTFLYFDLDRFKSVNDTLGRNYGDLLLREVADRTRSLAPSSDLVARLDADHFAIVRSGRVTADEARRLATRLIGELTGTYLLNGHRAIVGVSVGIAHSTASDDDPVSLMKNAETAHRRAKSAGGNVCMFFDPALDLGLRARQALEIEMRDALGRDEFSVVYQPQLDLSSNTLVGVEALLRWHHPVRGAISPAEFIPVAEDTGLIEALGAWVLRRACQDAASWPKPIKVAVNVSPIQFKRGDLVETVTDALQASGLPPTQLDLEITESLFIHESSVVTSTTDALRESGVTFSLDDFGTGYSSLNYLRKFQVNKIKLDRSFVTGLPVDVESIAIVRAVCAMAADLEIRTNAEGVETPEQMDCLRLLGCKEGQGFFFGKPQPASDIARLLAASGVPAVEAA